MCGLPAGEDMMEKKYTLKELEDLLNGSAVHILCDLVDAELNDALAAKISHLFAVKDAIVTRAISGNKEAIKFCKDGLDMAYEYSSAKGKTEEGGAKWQS